MAAKQLKKHFAQTVLKQHNKVLCKFFQMNKQSMTSLSYISCT